MSNDVAQIRVRLLADLADLEKMQGQVSRSLRSINSEAKAQMGEARGTFALLGDEIGVKLPRHLQTFLAKLPGVAPVMAAAFSVTAIAALGMAVFEAGEKIAEFIKKNQEAAAKLKEAQESFGLVTQNVYNSYAQKLLQAGIQADNLRNDHIDALHKQLELIDMQGFDNLAEAFGKLSASADKTFNELKEGWLDTVSTFITSGSLQSGVAGFQSASGNFSREYSRLLSQGNGTEAQSLLNSTQRREEQNRSDLMLMRSSGLTSDTANLSFTDAQHQSALTRLRGSGISDYSDKSYGASTQLTSMLESLQVVADKNKQLTSAQETNTKSTESLRQSELALAEARKQSDIWVKQQQEGGRITVLGKQAAREQHEQMNARPVDDGFGMIGNRSMFTTSPEVEAQSAAITKQMSVEQAKLNESLTASATKYQLATGAISAHDAALQMAAAHSNAFAAELDALDAQLKILQSQTLLAADDMQKNKDEQTRVLTQQAQLRAAAQAQQMEDARATESAMDQVFDHLRAGAQDIQQKIAAIMERTLDGINDNIVGAMFGDKTNFGKVFEQQSRSLAKTTLEWAEGSLTGKGSKGKLNDLQLSATNGSLNVHVTGATSTGASGSTSAPGASSSAPSVLSSIPGVSAVSSLAGNVGKWFTANGSKYVPGVMQGIGGLMSMFSGPEHAHGEGSGVSNALSRANYNSNSLSRFLGGFGQITSGAGSALFAGAGGMGGLDKSLQGSNASSGMAGLLSNFIGGLPGFASGGDPTGGVPIMVGETGPEVWSPPTSGGHITPNRDLSGMGSAPTYVIDARGTDPALTQANVARAIQSSNSHAVSRAQSRMVDRQRRTPSR